MFSEGNGTLSAPIAIHHIDIINPIHLARSRELLIHDIDGNGTGDVSLIDRVDLPLGIEVRVKSLLQQSAEFEAVNFDSGESGIRTSFLSATFFDLNNDEVLDFVGAGFTFELLQDSLVIRYGDGSGGFGDPETISIQARPSRFAFDDVNSDGTIDVMILPQFGGDVSNVLINSDGSILEEVVTQLADEMPYMPPADVAASPTRSIFVTKVGTTHVPVEIGLSDRSRHDAVTADFNGDGVAGDVLLAHNSGFALLRNLEPAEVLLPGDIDSNGMVDFADFLILATNFGREDNVTRSEGDLNLDGKVTFSDFLVLAANFGRNMLAE